MVTAKVEEVVMATHGAILRRRGKDNLCHTVHKPFPTCSQHEREVQGGGVDNGFG